MFTASTTNNADVGDRTAMILSRSYPNPHLAFYYVAHLVSLDDWYRFAKEEEQNGSSAGIVSSQKRLSTVTIVIVAVRLIRWTATIFGPPVLPMVQWCKMSCYFTDWIYHDFEI